MEGIQVELSRKVLGIVGVSFFDRFGIKLHSSRQTHTCAKELGEGSALKDRSQVVYNVKVGPQNCCYSLKIRERIC